MASLNTDLRNALVAALRADATFATVVGNTAGTAHVEGGDQPDSYHEGATGVAYVRVLDDDLLEEYEESAITSFKFEVRVQPVDIFGAAEALSLVKQGLRNALRDGGASVFTTYFTDTNTNRRGASGMWGLDRVEIEPVETTADPDRPQILATVFCDVGHVVPLV